MRAPACEPVATTTGPTLATRLSDCSMPRDASAGVVVKSLTADVADGKPRESVDGAGPVAPLLPPNVANAAIPTATADMTGRATRSAHRFTPAADSGGGGAFGSSLTGCRNAAPRRAQPRGRRESSSSRRSSPPAGQPVLTVSAARTGRLGHGGGERVACRRARVARANVAPVSGRWARRGRPGRRGWPVTELVARAARLKSLGGGAVHEAVGSGETRSRQVAGPGEVVGGDGLSPRAGSAGQAASRRPRLDRLRAAPVTELVAGTARHGGRDGPAVTVGRARVARGRPAVGGGRPARPGQCAAGRGGRPIGARWPAVAGAPAVTAPILAARVLAARGAVPRCRSPVTIGRSPVTIGRSPVAGGGR